MSRCPGAGDCSGYGLGGMAIATALGDRGRCRRGGGGIVDRCSELADAASLVAESGATRWPAVQLVASDVVRALDRSRVGRWVGLGSSFMATLAGAPGRRFVRWRLASKPRLFCTKDWEFK